MLSVPPLQLLELLGWHVKLFSRFGVGAFHIVASWINGEMVMGLCGDFFALGDGVCGLPDASPGLARQRAGFGCLQYRVGSVVW